MHPITPAVKLHGAALRLLYRVLAPRHPRGWLDFHAIHEGEGPNPTLWIHCHGMERWSLPNVEMVGVPSDLRGYAHGILMDVTGYMKLEKRMSADENFSGLFVSADQMVFHMGTVRNAPERDAGHAALRVVDLEQPASAGFPYRLVAAHLLALAERSSSGTRREQLYRRATEIFPGEFLSEEETGNPDMPGYDAQKMQLRTNLAAWDGLGLTIASGGRYEQGFAAFEQAIARCPAWGRWFKKQVTAEIGKSFPPKEHPVSRFWLELDVDAVRARCAPRR
jgi:hypothetical protein